MTLELSSGDGFVDNLFKPRKGKAISQINDKDNIDHLRKEEYKGMVLLAGIKNSNRTEKHTSMSSCALTACRMDRMSL